MLALVPVVALGAVLAYELNAGIQQRYLDSSRASATLIATVGIQPLLNAEQMVGGLSPSDIAQVNEKLQGASVSTEVRRIKVWNRQGTVVYSDNPTLIGRTFPIDDDLAAALGGRPSASITSGHDQENASDNLAGPLIQVYVPLVFQGSSSASGAFELYLPYAPVQSAIDAESHQLYLLLAIGLTVFYAAMFPVVLLADRWRRRAEATALANIEVLERLNRIKSEFLVRISHQFRTALVGIEGFSEVIRDADRLDLAEVKSFATDIYNDAERLDRAFDSMLELDRMEAGHAALDLAVVDVNRVVTDAVALAGKEDPAALITTRLAESLPPTRCDRDKVARLVTILIENAVRYSPTHSEVEVMTELRDGEVRVSVSDRGPGMPAGYDPELSVGALPTAPSRFGDLDGAANRTGLGLSIARQIVHMHRGRIWFESRSDRGTVFHFSLPTSARVKRPAAAVAVGASS